MQLLIVIALSLLLAHSALGSPYKFARQCKSSNEPCMSLRCGIQQPSGNFPQSTTYGCCLGKIIDGRKHVCAVTSGVTHTLACNPCTEFNCGNGECTLASWKCDGDKNCQDGSDEFGCGFCGKDNFRCSNGRCISKQLVCDKVNHCGDGSDEMHCLRPSGTPCGTKSYRCANNKCLYKQSVVCNGVNDCGDWSDERGCSSKIGKKRSTRYLSEHHDFEEANNKTEAGKPEPKDTTAILMKN